MTEPAPDAYTSFDGHRRIASGTLEANALAVKKALESGADGPVLIFDDATGRCVDVDTRGSDEDVATRLAAPARDARRDGSIRLDPSSQPVAPDAMAQGSRGPGRPRLGVVPREVTLLPRHWEWLAAQPGGASVTLRKLVENARRTGGDEARTRQAHERAYHFMSAIAGDFPGFEEATRALFANDPIRFRELVGAWPGDVREHATRLAFGDRAGAASPDT